MGKSQAAQQGEILENQEIIKNRLPKPPAKQAEVPKGTPIRKSWHVQRHHVTEAVVRALTGGEGPALVGLVGDSGSGKTTAASEIVRITEVREAFPDGILWLTVNKGAKGRLPSLMLQLSRMVHNDIEGSVGHPPLASDDGAAYIKQRMMGTSHPDGVKGFEKKTCLVVADNVWEKESVSKLMETGMWVLVSTRDEELVKGARGYVVGVDELSEADAESVLRRASELSPEVRLPDGAVDLIELCGRVAMDLAFVGRWSTIRRRQDRAAWSDAAGMVRAYMENEQVDSVRDDAVDSRSKRRKAILRAGFEDLATGSDDERVPRLYLSLTVMPDGHAFTLKDAAVLLCDRTPTAEDEASAGEVVDTLERWTVIRSTESTYRMHDAHATFARESLMDRGDVRRQALKRWVKAISSLDAVRSTDPFHLKSRWRAVESVGGDAWDTVRPYAAALAVMDHSDPLLLRKSIEAVARFQGAQEDYEGASISWRRLLGVYQRDLGDDHPYVLNTLQSLADCAERLGNIQEVVEWRKKERETFPLALTRTQLQLDGGESECVDDACGLAYVATTILTWAPNRYPEAEMLLRRCLGIQEVKLGPDDLQVAHTLYKLAVCIGKAGRLEEAERLSRRCLAIREANLGLEDVGVAYTLYDLGSIVRAAGRLEESEALFRRCLGIRETKLGKGDVHVAYTLYCVGECALQAGRLDEAEALLRRCLGIQEGVEQRDLKRGWPAQTVYTLAQCVRQVGRLQEAKELRGRFLGLRAQAAWTLPLHNVDVTKSIGDKLKIVAHH